MSEKEPRRVFVHFDHDSRDFHVIDLETGKGVASGFKYAHRAFDYATEKGYKVVRGPSNGP